MARRSRLSPTKAHNYGVTCCGAASLGVDVRGNGPHRAARLIAACGSTPAMEAVLRLGELRLRSMPVVLDVIRERSAPGKDRIRIAKATGCSSSASGAFSSARTMRPEPTSLPVAQIMVFLSRVVAWGPGDGHTSFLEAWFAIGFAISWAGLIDTLQSLVNAVWPGSNTNGVFKYVRAVNPVALGGIAVDSVATIVHCFVDRQ